MKCPKCNTEYNTMEEVVKCLSKHIADKKEDEKAIYRAKRDKELEAIKKCFNEITNMIDRFNNTYSDTKIKKPSLLVTTSEVKNTNNSSNIKNLEKNGDWDSFEALFNQIFK